MDWSIVDSLNDGNDVPGELFPCVRGKGMGASRFMLASTIDGDNTVTSSAQRRQHR